MLERIRRISWLLPYRLQHNRSLLALSQQLGSSCPAVIRYRSGRIVAVKTSSLVYRHMFPVRGLYQPGPGGIANNKPTHSTCPQGLSTKLATLLDRVLRHDGQVYSGSDEPLELACPLPTSGAAWKLTVVSDLRLSMYHACQSGHRTIDIVPSYPIGCGGSLARHRLWSFTSDILVGAASGVKLGCNSERLVNTALRRPTFRE